MACARLLVVTLLVAASLQAEEPRWRSLLQPSDKRQIGTLCAAGDELVAVGHAAWRSRDGGATWTAAGALPGDPHWVDGAFALFCRGKNAWAVGAHGQIWRSDGGDWTRLATPTTETLHVIAGDDTLILAAGEGGTVLASRDGSHFTVEKRGGSEIMTAVLVAGGRGFVLGGNALWVRAPDGGWRRRTIGERGDRLAALVRDGKGGLRLLSSSGRRWRSPIELDRFAPEPALEPGARGSCDDMAVGGGEIVWLCRHTTGNPMAMDPPMESLLLVSGDDGRTVRREPVPAGLGGVWAVPSGAIYGLGAGVWRRVTSAAPTP